MTVFGRRRKLPAERRPPLARDERILAWAPVEGEDVLVATNRGLWLPAGTGSAAQRLGWAEIHKAAWSGRELAVTPAAEDTTIDGYAVMNDQPVRRFQLADPGDVPHQVRARVTRSVAYTVHHELPGGGGVRVVARRVPGIDGLLWTVRYDDGGSVDDPVVREVTSQFVAQAQAAINQ
ncbi:MAG TPA: hypothetical protein VJT31_26010 [Rugosimonospora sp.]|nr:hypothetical protein [Rugosimonospora sp.]